MYIRTVVVTVVLVGRIQDPFERFALLLAVSGAGSANVLGKLAAAGIDTSMDGAGSGRLIQCWWCRFTETSEIS